MLARLRPCDTYALNLTALWGRFNGELLPVASQRILIAGCGTFSHYPFSLANPGAGIVALDLSGASLRRARLHARIHGCTNVDFLEGDLLRPEIAPGPFHFIDAYGVLHHLPDPSAGLMALSERVAEGGIIRIMVYSRGARREIESARRAFRLLGVRDLATGRELVRRAAPDSRLGRCYRSIPEARADSGFADVFLHPSVRTFTVDMLMEMAAKAPLEPLLFAHRGALPDIGAEVERLRKCEASGEVNWNYTLYLGKSPAGERQLAAGSRLVLNPVLRRVVSGVRIFPLTVDARLGSVNPVLSLYARRFLRRFLDPVPVAEMNREDLQTAGQYLSAMFLFCVR